MPCWPQVAEDCRDADVVSDVDAKSAWVSPVEVRSGVVTRGELTAPVPATIETNFPLFQFCRFDSSKIRISSPNRASKEVFIEISLMKTRNLPPSLIANLQNVLSKKNERDDVQKPAPEPSSSSLEPAKRKTLSGDPKAVILVTNGDGIECEGLKSLVEVLVRTDRFEIHVCVPESNKSLSGHSVSIKETVVASSVDINCTSAFEVSGTPVDCVSLSLSGALFGFSKPTLVISGIGKGSSCPNHLFYSGTLAAAREASMNGIPSLSISLNWKKDESSESDFQAAADCCLPLIVAIIRDIEKDVIPKGCFLNVDIPTSPKTCKSFRVNRLGVWKPTLSWQAVHGYRPPSAQFMSKHQSLGIQLAQLGRDASAAGAARRLNTHRETVEVESVAAADKIDSLQGKIKKHFRLEVIEKDHVEGNKDVENGFVTVTPIYHDHRLECESSLTSLSEWIANTLPKSL